MVLTVVMKDKIKVILSFWLAVFKKLSILIRQDFLEVMQVILSHIQTDSNLA